METNKTSSSTLVERVTFMQIFSSMCVSVALVLLKYLDGGATIPEYIGMFFGGLIFTPLASLLLSLAVFLFVFIAFGEAGRKTLHKIWIIITYIGLLIFCFLVLYTLYTHGVWMVVFESLKNKKYHDFIIPLVAIFASALFVYMSSFLLTEEQYLKAIERLNKASENK